MRGEDEKKSEEGSIYRYKKCKACGAKLHTEARYCLKCGADYWYKCFTREWEDIYYRSSNPEDAVYSMPMNEVEKCMKCRNLLELGTLCEKKFCFATGRGKCENCRTFDMIIFECCQETQAKEGTPDPTKMKKLVEHYCDIVRGKRPAPVQKPAQQEYTDEIPF